MVLTRNMSATRRIFKHSRKGQRKNWHMLYQNPEVQLESRNSGKSSTHHWLQGPGHTTGWPDGPPGAAMCLLSKNHWQPATRGRWLGPPLGPYPLAYPCPMPWQETPTAVRQPEAAGLQVGLALACPWQQQRLAGEGCPLAQPRRRRYQPHHWASRTTACTRLLGTAAPRVQDMRRHHLHSDAGQR